MTTISCGQLTCDSAIYMSTYSRYDSRGQIAETGRQHEARRTEYRAGEYKAVHLPGLGYAIETEPRTYTVITQITSFDINDSEMIIAMMDAPAFGSRGDGVFDVISSNEGGVTMFPGMIVDFPKIGKCVFLDSYMIDELDIEGIDASSLPGIWIYLDPKKTQPAFAGAEKIQEWRTLAGIEA